MEVVTPQGALLALCIARLPGRSLPRHAWAAEVLVEQLWASSVGAGREEWRRLLAPLINDGGVNARRVRSEVWELARNGALEPVGAGQESRFTVTSETVQKSEGMVPLACVDQDVIDKAVDQLTARLFTFSK
ncbi:hypothetical protein [Streptomyces sp. NPDC004546]|uniref:hypothetical protein n=1 Tax=Streptomyces sp. NPDC004546 TaxID=3154282 RepID=UPI0033A51663